MAAQTLYLNRTATVTLTTAAGLVTSPPAAESSLTSLKTAKNTANWGTFWALAANTTWQNAVSEAAFGDVHGFLLDDTSLEGLTADAGTWSATMKVSSSSGTLTGVLHVRVGKRSSAGVYTEIVNMAVASQGYTSTPSVVTCSGSGAVTAFAVGDKLYVQVDLQITANTSSATTATTNLYLNGGANESIVTPNISGAAPASLVFPQRASLRHRLNR